MMKGRYNIMPTCPYCHKELLYGEMYDEYSDGVHVYQYYNGPCPVCSRNFKWIECYDYTGYCDLEEEEEYDHSYEEAEKENL